MENATEEKPLFAEWGANLKDIYNKLTNTLSSEEHEILRKLDKGLRVLLVGKSGTGKSTVGNRLLEKTDVRLRKKKKQSAESSSASAAAGFNADEGKDEDMGFVVYNCLDSGTTRTAFKQAHAWDRDIQVIDTPGLCDPSEDAEKTLKKITCGLSLCCPGPSAILFVARCDVRFTKEERETFHAVHKLFETGVERHLILVLTHGEYLDNEDMTIDELFDEAPDTFKEVLKIVGDNYAVVSSTTKDPEIHQKQMKNLFQKIDKVASKGYFVNEYINSMNKVMVRAMKEMIIKKKVTVEQAEKIVKGGIANEDPYFSYLVMVLGLVVLTFPFWALLGIPVVGLAILLLSPVAFVGGVATLAIGSFFYNTSTRCAIM